MGLFHYLWAYLKSCMVYSRVNYTFKWFLPKKNKDLKKNFVLYLKKYFLNIKKINLQYFLPENMYIKIGPKSSIKTLPRQKINLLFED